jgi:hypothetical protein
VWLTPQSLQVGLDANAVIVDGLSPAHQRFIRALQAGIADNQVSASARYAHLPVGEARQLVERLRPQLLASSNGLAAESNERPSTIELLRRADPDFAELIRFALGTNTDGLRAVAGRANRVIHIERFDRTGVAVLRGLASAGFAQFWSSDEGQVEREDITALGFERQSLGKSRFEAACDLADGFGERVALLDTSALRKRILDRVDLAILIGGQSMDESRSRLWQRHGIPHLAVLFRSDGVMVSPIVTPNKTACLACVESALSSTDPHAAVKLIQLRRSRTAYDDSSSVLFGAAMTVAATSDFLDSQQGFEHSAFERTGWFFERATGSLMRLDWPPLEACGCGQSAARNLDGDAGRPNASTAA